MARTAAARPTNHSRETTILRNIEYLSAPAAVSMADQWFEIAAIDHFWIRRRFDVLRRLAGGLISAAREMAEIGCGNGLLQRQIEETYGREVTGFDLNEYALRQNLSRISKVCCYDIYQEDMALRERFDLIFLFDVLEHVADEDRFFKALMFHLAPGGKVVVNVPAGMWAYSAYDEAAGHARRYSIRTLRAAAERNNLEVTDWSYWGLPLVPALALRKLWLIGHHDQNKIISAGFDSRTPAINKTLGFVARCEPIPQKFLGTSLMAVLQARRGSRQRRDLDR
jgi:2-polyprenyl-3-methyl-5-hydroxy-6-metoxy-1,4-benzoquinol methylase